MKKLLLLIVFVILEVNLIAQSTFLTRLSFNYGGIYSHYPADTILHIKELSTTNFGSVYINIASANAKSNIYKIENNGNFLWTAPHYGYLGPITRNRLSGLKATPDGGCIYSNNLESFASYHYKRSEIYKFGRFGQQEYSWTLPQYSPVPNIYLQETFDIAVLPNGYACLAEDSLYIINSINSSIRSLNFKGPGKIYGFQNGDMFIVSPTFKGRIDNNGNVLYSLFGKIYNRDSTFFVHTGDTLFQLDSQNGLYVNPIYFPAAGLTNVLMQKDGGWLRYSDFDIIKYDNVGIQKWSKHLHLPVFGVSLITELDTNYLLTGGTFLSQIYDWFGMNRNYSAFVFSIDSLGNSIMDSVSAMTSGDANDDNFFEGSDALYVALAQGSTGPVRKNSLSSSSYDSNIVAEIGIDFPNSFLMGANHMQSDANGNGIVDSIDINKTLLYGNRYPRTTP
ncbi:MAG: hypothetical protein DWQ44_09965 [Bacteroidetes bacterium]|nr:MAG: hypothetical protein DWQ33_10240 [Bacteroidota bacterium]REK06605.1 MAG: hypothetical protein DWQ39_03755 [Bacteroidota bacterium]REK33371.1 MAG: hypothetical protein DWQ44_09965 [Bacteroidota bacterium]REK49770.1 MAG: hypothetical protein DWQ48_06520 [Bacteroidota bacterium]